MSCPACDIEARIGTNDEPHPLPRVYHACVARVIGEDERRVLALLDRLTREARDLVTRWRNDALEAAGDYYACQYDSHDDCADELERVLGRSAS